MQIQLLPRQLIRLKHCQTTHRLERFVMFFFLPSISQLNTSDSGLLLMLTMIQLQMRTTLQFHVYLEGNMFFNMCRAISDINISFV